MPVSTGWPVLDPPHRSSEGSTAGPGKGELEHDERPALSFSRSRVLFMSLVPPGRLRFVCHSRDSIGGLFGDMIIIPEG